MSTADVKVDAVATEAGVPKPGVPKPGVPKQAKLAQILSILVSSVIALAVSSVLADGQSVIILKPVKDLPPATNPALKDLVSHHKEHHIQLKYNLAELLGPGYGVGLHHDQSGHIWNEAGAEDQDLAFLIKDLGIDAVMAAVPSVISTDGESRAPAGTRRTPALLARPNRAPELIVRLDS